MSCFVKLQKREVFSGEKNKVRFYSQGQVEGEVGGVRSTAANEFTLRGP